MIPEDNNIGMESPVDATNETIDMKCTACEDDLLDEISSRLDQLFPDISPVESKIVRDAIDFGRKNEKKVIDRGDHGQHMPKTPNKPEKTKPKVSVRPSRGKRRQQKALLFCSTAILLAAGVTGYYYYRSWVDNILATPVSAEKLNPLSETNVHRQLIEIAANAANEIRANSTGESTSEFKDDISAVPVALESDPMMEERQIDPANWEPAFGNTQGPVVNEKQAKSDAPETTYGMATEPDSEKTPVEKGTPDTIADSAGPDVLPARERKQEITDFLVLWKTAWEKTAGIGGDMDAYMAFYAETFSAKGFDKKGWATDKAAKNRRKSWIKIELSDIRIPDPVIDNETVVHFSQNYRSSNFSDRSTLSLALKKEESGWIIIGIQ